MKKQILLAAFTVFSCFLYAQDPKLVLQKLKDSFPQERIHIHFDKELYMAGETIWFKAYLMDGFLPSELSANFIAELTDQNNHVILQKKLPVLSGTVAGNFDLPDSLDRGNYIFRAYTPWMLNFDEAFVFRKPVFVYKPSVKIFSTANETSSLHIDLFPEGGELVSNVVNVVAFKAIDKQGFPVAVTGRLIDASGSEIVSFSSVHDGMGTFGFIPKTAEQYRAEITFADSSTRNIVLPATKETGWLLQVREETDTKRRIILARAGASPVADLVLIGQMQQELLFEQSLQIQGTNSIISLDTRPFPSGILQLTLLTKSGVPLAERLLFINNNEYRFPINLQSDTVSLSKKAKNVLSFSLPDSIAGSFSVSVTDHSKITHGDYNSDDIISRLLLTADLKGYIHNPSFYFGKNDKATRAALDLVMMTHGWRRFNWGQVMKNQFPVLNHRDQNHIQLSGTVFSQKTKKPVTGGEANFILRTKDSLTDFFQAPIGNNGRFELDNLVYSDTAQFSFQLNSKKNREKELYIELDKDNTDYSLTGRRLLSSTRNNFPFCISTSDSLKTLYSFSSDTSGNYGMLEAVTVTAKKKRPLDDLNQRYTSGLFSSMNMVRILDLVNNEPGAGAQNVFQYVQGRIGGLKIMTSGFPPSYTVYTQRAMSLTGGPIPIPLYLDEAPTTSGQLATIPMNQVAMIKFFQTGFMGSPGIGTTSALAVYTKRSFDRKDFGPGYLNAFKYPGYSPVREFYSPDYEQSPETRDLADRRITLLWQPEIKIDPETGKYLIRFFNSDNARRIKVIIEGVTADGKFVREEKVLQ